MRTFSAPGISAFFLAHAQRPAAKIAAAYVPFRLYRVRLRTRQNPTHACSLLTP